MAYDKSTAWFRVQHCLKLLFLLVTNIHMFIQSRAPSWLSGPGIIYLLDPLHIGPAYANEAFVWVANLKKCNKCIHFLFTMCLWTFYPLWYFETWMVLNHDLLSIIAVLMTAIYWVAWKRWTFWRSSYVLLNKSNSKMQTNSIDVYSYVMSILLPRCWRQQISWSYCATSWTFSLVAWRNTKKKVIFSGTRCPARGAMVR